MSGLSHAELAARSRTLKRGGRLGDALALDREAVRLYGRTSPVAWHNLAATLGDLGCSRESGEAAERALGLGLDAPETWLTYANAKASLNELEAAVRAFQEVLRRRPTCVQSTLSLARLLWMLRGDLPGAVGVLEAGVAAGAEPAPLLIQHAKFLEHVGDRAGARRVLDELLERHGDQQNVPRAAAEFYLVEGEARHALELAEEAVRLAPGVMASHAQRVAALLGLGRTNDALSAARRMTELAPLDQSSWGWFATAARAARSPAYPRLADYETFVRSYVIPIPPGWASLPEFLQDLRTTLHRLHRFREAPAEQSVRGGVQTGADLRRTGDPVIMAFFQAASQMVRRYLADIGQGPDPLRARNLGGWLIQDSWSIWLQPQGHHANHLHPRGWISSAFYVDVPSRSVGREGWLAFGEPPFRTTPELPPDHYVRPEPGRLVLFPSYVWHGTVPFTAEAESRLTIAFDILPSVEEGRSSNGTPSSGVSSQ